MSAPDTGQAPSLDELRDTLAAIGECARPLTALDAHALARQAAVEIKVSALIARAEESEA